MFFSIILFIFTGLTFFVICFCFDKVELWNGCNDIPNLKMPSIDDVKNINDFKKSDYVVNVIAPAYHYFEEKSEIMWYQSKENDSKFPCSVVLMLILALLQSRNLLKIGFTNNRMLCLLISIAICLLSFFIARFIYKKTPLPLCKFTYTFDKLQAEHDHFCQHNEYGLSRDVSLNNYIINIHANYLSSIKTTVIFRSNIRKVICAFACIVYVLFFMQLPG